MKREGGNIMKKTANYSIRDLIALYTSLLSVRGTLLSERGRP